MADLVDAANPDEVERYLSGGGIVTVGLPLAMAGYIRELKAELAAARKPTCVDLRHVCGGCGFKWPERSAYDELTLSNAQLHDELIAEKALTDALVSAMNADILDSDTYWKAVFAAKAAITKAREAEKSGQGST